MINESLRKTSPDLGKNRVDAECDQRDFLILAILVPGGSIQVKAQGANNSTKETRETKDARLQIIISYDGKKFIQNIPLIGYK